MDTCFGSSIGANPKVSFTSRVVTEVVMTSRNLISLLIVVTLWEVAWQFRVLKVRQAILLGASFYSNCGFSIFAVRSLAKRENRASSQILRRSFSLRSSRRGR